VILIDGCARGNPGPAGCGVIILDADARTILEKARYLGTATNNVAEYTALIDGLREAVDLGAREVGVRTDSELVVKQMKGEYKVKDVKLKELFAEAQRLSRGFAVVSFTHVQRENNKEADRLANRAVDSFLGVKDDREPDSDAPPPPA
jgi:ribonuclease HI